MVTHFSFCKDLYSFIKILSAMVPESSRAAKRGGRKADLRDDARKAEQGREGEVETSRQSLICIISREDLGNW